MNIWFAQAPHAQAGGAGMFKTEHTPAMPPHAQARGCDGFQGITGMLQHGLFLLLAVLVEFFQNDAAHIING